jgi:hypothetical protein
MRTFNTSGPNILNRHYTIIRQNIIDKGIKLVNNERYFTIWAPRQTGKSTYFRLLANELEKDAYKVAHINFESYRTTPESTFLKNLTGELNKFWNTNFPQTDISDIFYQIELIKKQKCVLIIDEVEGINTKYLNTFLHAIRKAYHSRENHCLKSVILVGVANITGIIKDNASPFNIADQLDMPYFTNEETYELFAQHETETGQIFDNKVKQKISEITANQPGLINGFAKRLVDTNPEKERLTYEDYLDTEQWYLDEVIDKNISNVLNKADEHRRFVEKLLFTRNKIRYRINDNAIKELHTNGLIKSYKDPDDKKLYVQFWVPLYKKVLFDYYYPYTNGEGENIAENMFVEEYLNNKNEINFDKLIDSYKQHINLRSFRPYREKDKDGNFKSIPEAAMIYSFETFISVFLQIIKARSYREAQISLGNTDLIINVKGFEYFIETKKYYNPSDFKAGKDQIAYYCKRAGIKKGIYIVFIKNTIKSDRIKENTEIINNVEIKTYLIIYDEKKEFGKDNKDIEKQNK